MISYPGLRNETRQHPILVHIPTPTTPLKTNPGAPTPSSPGTLERVAMVLYLETELKQEVVYEGETVLLSGLADYLFRYRQ